MTDKPSTPPKPTAPATSPRPFPSPALDYDKRDLDKGSSGERLD